MGITEIFLRLFLAIGLGVLMGLEHDGNWKTEEELAKDKERAKKSKNKFNFIQDDLPASGLGGVRTFIFISVLGFLSGLSMYVGYTIVVTIISLFIGIFVLSSYFLNYFDKNTLGLTTELSIFVLYICSILMFIPTIELRVVVAITVMAILISSMKKELRSVVSKFTRREIVDSTKFILFTIVILPFLPNKSFGLDDLPLVGGYFFNSLSSELLQASNVINPFGIWIIVVFISSLTFIGYYLTKVFRNRQSLNVLAAIGGMVSSTAVTEAMALTARKIKNKRNVDSLINAALLANATSFARIFIVSMTVNIYFAIKLMPALLVMSLTLYLLFYRNKVGAVSGSEAEDKIQFKSPFSILPSIAFGLIYTVVVLTSSMSLVYFGEGGFLFTQLFASLTGMDAVTINSATSAGTLVSESVALITLMAALFINLLAKLIFAGLTSTKNFVKPLAIKFGIASFTGFAMLIFILIFLV